MARDDKRKFRSTKRKKKRGFFGKRPQETSTSVNDNDTTTHLNPESSAAVTGISTSVLPAERESISTKKLLNSSFEKFENNEHVFTRQQARQVGLGPVSSVDVASGYKLQDAELLSECISDAAVCSSCCKPSSQLQLFQRNNEREGLSESLFLKCSSCKIETPLSTSKRLGGKGGGAHDVNRRSVLASLGQNGLTNFCAAMNLPPPVTKKAYNEHLIQIEKAAIGNAEQQMQDAARRVREKVAREQPDDILDDVASVAVTVDGTWQKRGHSSKIGVIFVISVDTGEIFCHECKAHNDDDKDSDKYKEWKQAHETRCQINHHGSSEEMEATAAVEIFSRSISSRKLKYTTFVGDGDSSSFGWVKEALEKKFGVEYVIVKEECVGHVQKRLGTALRKYKSDMKGKKLSDGKTVGGKNRLTDKVIDRMQNFYGKAIRENKGDLEGMQTSIKAIHNHMIKSNASLDQQHQYCPKSGDTWCKYWKDKTNDTSTYNEDNRLPDLFMKELEPIFSRLSKGDLLNRCLKGMTQNQNEAANGMLWSRCPKTKFCGEEG
jgi:hypothetical protein